MNEKERKLRIFRNFLGSKSHCEKLYRKNWHRKKMNSNEKVEKECKDDIKKKVLSRLFL